MYNICSSTAILRPFMLSPSQHHHRALQIPCWQRSLSAWQRQCQNDSNGRFRSLKPLQIMSNSRSGFCHTTWILFYIKIYRYKLKDSIYKQLRSSKHVQCRKMTVYTARVLEIYTVGDGVMA